MMSSSTLWGNISDQYGRKTVRLQLLLQYVPMFLAWVFQCMMVTDVIVCMP